MTNRIQSRKSLRPMWGTVSIALAFISILLVLAFGVWAWVFGVLQFSPLQFVEGFSSQDMNWAVTAALTTAGGIGAGVLVAVNYRRMNLEERDEVTREQERQKEFVNRCNALMSTYAEMISDHNPPRVTAGLRGMSALVDKFHLAAKENDVSETGVADFNQRCADTICVLIRSAHRLEDKIAAETIQTEGLKVIREHILPSASNSWSALSFDLHESQILCPIRMENTEFNGRLDLWGTKFKRSVYLGGATLRDVNMNGVEFSGRRAIFQGSTFHKVSFEGDCRFGGTVDFSDATFENGVAFVGQETGDDSRIVTYPGSTKFESSVSFMRTKFHGGAIFDQAVFGGFADFSYATFTTASFVRARAEQSVCLDNVKWETGAAFDRFTVADNLQLQRWSAVSGAQQSVADMDFGFFHLTVGGDLLLYDTDLATDTNFADYRVGGTIAPPGALKKYKSQARP